MNVEEAGGDEFQEEHLPEGGQGFDLSTNDILNQVWESVEDAYKFYRRYGRVNGFRVRKGDSGKDSNGLREIRHYDRIDR
ncbi:hypothetical protein Ahy_B10g104205 [Arachis hypogaea]|uniref:FAR1 domain-containing protein n=1 Tax=Arachis hypogaea TaxID=3818 RepID=A0A444X4Z8_ARAHY|nr:hypothetical protein Ahy_B10g104205 [Arachis hypogaea]